MCINGNCDTVALVTFYDDKFAQLREAVEFGLGDTPTTTVRGVQIVVYRVRKTYDHARLKTFFYPVFLPTRPFVELLVLLLSEEHERSGAIELEHH